jgi:hypothetical protein
MLPIRYDARFSPENKGIPGFFRNAFAIRWKAIMQDTGAKNIANHRTWQLTWEIRQFKIAGFQCMPFADNNGNKRHPLWRASCGQAAFPQSPRHAVAQPGLLP